MIKREKVLKGLEHCTSFGGTYTPCDGCPYDDAEEHCQGKLLEEVLSLLREQEPRVMTKEEVREDHDRVVWIEYRAFKTPIVGQYRGQVIWHNGQVGKWEQFVTTSFADDYLHIESDRYGVSWRCWTSRPSERRMLETPWEGERE